MQHIYLISRLELHITSCLCGHGTTYSRLDICNIIWTIHFFLSERLYLILQELTLSGIVLFWIDHGKQHKTFNFLNDIEINELKFVPFNFYRYSSSLQIIFLLYIILVVGCISAFFVEKLSFRICHSLTASQVFSRLQNLFIICS